MMKFGLTVLTAVLLAGSVTFAQADLSTLERKVQDAETALARVESSSANVSELNEIRDDLTYLRVKARRGETISSRERQDLSTRIDRFMSRIGAAQTEARTRDRSQISGRMIPAGSELDVRLQTRLYSDTAAVEDRVEATTIVDLYRGEELIVPAGSSLVGHVTSVDRASRTDRKGSLTVEFNRLSVNGRTYDVRANVIEALESEGLKGEVGRIGAGAGVGAIIGGILGGVKGAIAGVLIGGGGVIAATEGKDVDLPPGTILRVRFDEAVPLRH